MSQLPNGNNAYVNGDHGSNHSYRDDSSAGGRKDHRPGGYTALNSNAPNLSFPLDREQGTTAPLDHQSAGIDTGYGYPRHRAADRNHAGGPGAVGSRVRDGPAMYGNGPAGRQIEGAHLMHRART